MTIDELYNNISAGQYDSSMPYPSGKRYPEDHVFDEEKSVRWNREKVAEENKKRQQDLADYRASVRAGEDAFRNDVVSFIETEYGLNKVQAQAVFSLAYEHGHSAGFEEVLIHVQSFGSFAGDIIRML